MFLRRLVWASVRRKDIGNWRFMPRNIPMVHGVAQWGVKINDLEACGQWVYTVQEDIEVLHVRVK